MSGRRRRKPRPRDVFSGRSSRIRKLNREIEELEKAPERNAKEIEEKREELEGLWVPSKKGAVGESRVVWDPEKVDIDSFGADEGQGQVERARETPPPHQKSMRLIGQNEFDEFLRKIYEEGGLVAHTNSGGSLSSGQRNAVEALDEGVFMICACAGAGKTHALLEKIRHIVEGKRATASEILVLSFTNSAVFEIRRRLYEMGTDWSDGVKVSTMDSFAFSVNTDPTGKKKTAETEANRVFGGFKEEIEECRKNIDEGYFSRTGQKYRFVLVDECQDIEEPRSEMISAIVRSLPKANFSMFIDLHQGIYNFVDDEDDLDNIATRNAETIGGHSFVEQVWRASVMAGHNSPEIIHLEPIMFRAENSEMQELHREARESITQRRCDEFLDWMLDRSQRRGPRPRGQGEKMSLFRTRKALCRRLYISGLADDQHTIRLGAQFRHVPEWVTRLVLEAKKENRDLDYVDEDRFYRLMEEIAPEKGDKELDWIFSSLADGGKLEFEMIRRQMQEGEPSSKLKGFAVDIYGNGGTVYSTIHASKGLEGEEVEMEKFDLGAGSHLFEAVDTMESRVLYVGSTRARREFTLTEPPDWPGRLVGGAKERIRGADEAGGREYFGDTYCAPYRLGRDYLEFGRRGDIYTGIVEVGKVFGDIQSNLLDHPGSPVKCKIERGVIFISGTDKIIGKVSEKYVMDGKERKKLSFVGRWGKGRPPKCTRSSLELASKFYEPGRLKGIEDLYWYGNKSCSDLGKNKSLRNAGDEYRDARCYLVPLVYGLGKVPKGHGRIIKRSDPATERLNAINRRHDSRKDEDF